MYRSRRSSVSLVVSMASFLLMMFICLRVWDLEEEIYLRQDNVNIPAAPQADDNQQPAGRDRMRQESIEIEQRARLTQDIRDQQRDDVIREVPKAHKQEPTILNPIEDLKPSNIQANPESLNPLDFDIEAAMKELLPDNFDNHCDHLFTRPGYKGFSFSEFYKENLPKYEATMESLGGKDKLSQEGSSNIMVTETMMFHEAARWPFVKTACETGFNIGYSSFNYLSANPNLQVYSFDLGIHNGSSLMAGHLRTIFGNRINVIWGDSTKSLPMFIASHPDVRCDFMLADGGHTREIATADINNLIKMAQPGKSIIFYDDFPTPHLDIDAPWEDAIKDGRLKELFRCNPYNPRRGFAAAIVMKNT